MIALRSDFFPLHRLNWLSLTGWNLEHIMKDFLRISLICTVNGTNCFLIPALSLRRCETLSRLFHLSISQFLHL